MSERRLVVMRHAKAEPFASTDHARNLTERGLAAARDVGAHLGDEKVCPDHAVVSSATRTRATWDAVAGVCGAEATVVFDDALFNGTADMVIGALQAVPDDARTVMFVGHNPEAADLCHLLDDGEGDQSAMSGLLHGFPTAAVALFDVEVAWRELGPESARMCGFYVGRS